jgi:uncharacterized membrane protein
MAGLTPLGIFHTILGLVALVCGAMSLARHREISHRDRAGQIYLGATLLTAASALAIFQHGKFGPGHMLAILTLAALGVGTAAATTSLFGGASRAVQAASYSATLLFHVIPGVTESLTRLPPSAPMVASQEAPIFQKIHGALFVLYLVGVVMQIRWLRGASSGAGAVAPR